MGMKLFTNEFEEIKYPVNNAVLKANGIANISSRKILQTDAEFLNEIIPELRNNTLIDGGHYQLYQQNNKIIHKPNYLTKTAFTLAVALLKRAKEQNINAAPGFLINDLGLDDKARQFFKNHVSLHPEYVNILHYSGLAQNEILFFYESNLRNRATKKIIKSGLKKGIVKEESSILFVPELSESQKKATFLNQIGYNPASNSQSSLPIPFCRAIMSQKLSDSTKPGYTNYINILTENEYKCLGEFANLYHLFGGAFPVVNIVISNFELSDTTPTENNGLKRGRYSKSYYIDTETGYFAKIQKYIPEQEL